MLITGTMLHSRSLEFIHPTYLLNGNSIFLPPHFSLFVEEIIFSLLYVFDTLIENKFSISMTLYINIYVLYIYEFMSHLSILFCIVCLFFNFFWQYHALLITVALLYILKPGSMKTPTLFFLKSVLAIQYPFLVSYEF